MKRIPKATLAAAAAAALSGTPETFGQAFNIDSGTTLGVPTPPAPAYGAAAGQPGVWSVPAIGGSAVPAVLTDLSGAPTGVTLTNMAADPDFSFDNPLTIGDDEALLDDLLDVGAVGAASDYVFTGLVAGTYDVYTYAWAPDTPAFTTGISVNGLPVEVVGGAPWPGAHVEGVTYSLQTVTIAAGGIITVTATTVAGFGSINGFQLRPVSIRLSNAIAGDGSLVVYPDTFGAVTTWTWPGNNDFYDPAGPVGVVSPTFASALFIYKFFDTQIVLAEKGYNLDVTYPATPGTVITITKPLTGSDSDGDGVIDTAESAFTVMGPPAFGPFLDMTLCQRVHKPAPGSTASRFRQQYTFIASFGGMTFKAVRHHDMDLFMTGPAFTDVAGTIVSFGCDASAPAGVPLGPPINPYQREPLPEPPGTPFAIGLVPRVPGPLDPDYVYYAGRSGFDPDGPGPDPAMDFGTDFEIWDAFGLPPSWVNYTAGIGHAPLVGELPDAMPAAGLPPHDGFMGLQWDLSIPPGTSEVIEITTVYGAPTTPVTECYPDCTCDGLFTVADFACFQTKFVASDRYADCNHSGTLTVADFACFQTAFVVGCASGCP